MQTVRDSIVWCLVVGTGVYGTDGQSKSVGASLMSPLAWSVVWVLFWLIVQVTEKRSIYAGVCGLVGFVAFWLGVWVGGRG